MKLIKKGLFILLLIVSLVLTGCIEVKTDSVLTELEKARDDAYIDLLENKDAFNITSNVKFVGSDSIDITSIFISNNEDVISNEGIVKRGIENTNVIITLRVSKGSVFLEKEFNLTVLGENGDVITPPTPTPTPDNTNELLEEALNSSYIDLNGNISFNAITSDVRFINGNNKDIKYKWVSSNLEVLSDIGKVTRGSSDTKVIVTLTVSLNDKFKSKDFSLTILKEIKEDDEYTYDVSGKKSTYRPSDLPIVYENKEYNSHMDLVSYIYHFKHLPSNYLTKAKAQSMGWNGSGGNVWNNQELRGKYIGGDTFRNKEGHLPNVGSNVYVELDVNCRGGQRGSNRIVYNRQTFDVYYTNDHYRSFTYMIGA